MSQPKRQAAEPEAKGTAQLDSPAVALNSYLASMLADATSLEEEEYAEVEESAQTLTDLAVETV
ncbi:MAG: hypothetical protein WEB07_02940, partial [Natronospirillum sp.]